MTAATKRAKAKPARSSNGQANGVAAGSPPAVRPPQEVMPDLRPPAPVGHPYGDRAIFIWNPRDGGDPIVLPHFSTVEVSQEFLCKIYEKPSIFQNMEFMILAGVPMDIRLQVSRLGDNHPVEQNDLFTAWYSAATRPAGGELPGES